MDNIFIRGSAPINTIAILLGLSKFVEGCKLFKTNKFVVSDHRAYIININLEGYFGEELSH